MQYRFKLALAACALVALSVPALAQTPPPGQKPGQKPAEKPTRDAAAPREDARTREFQMVVFLPTDALSSITPLQDDQKTKIKAIHDQMHQDVKAAEGDHTKITSIRDQAETAIRGILTADQIKQIEHVMSAVSMLQRSHTIPTATLKDVKLSTDQWEQIVPIEADEYAKLKGATREQRQAVYADFKSRVTSILTDAQEEVLTKFEAAHPAPGEGSAPGQ
jgi:hypothetical protein